MSQQTKAAPPATVSHSPARRAPSSLQSQSTQQLVREALRSLPAPPPETPPWSHRLLPPSVRGLFADLGWWQDPAPQPPSTHLEQTLAVLQKYGWCQRLDVSVTGRLCIRGAQHVLQKTGHVTPHGRDRAVHHMQQTLTDAGISMPFYDWQDLPDLRFPAVENLLTSAAHKARETGE